MDEGKRKKIRRIAWTASLIALAGLLYGALAPMFSRTHTPRYMRHRIGCLSNMKQLALIEEVYAKEYGRFNTRLSDFYPKYTVQMIYDKNRSIFTCPATGKTRIREKEDIDKYTSYFINPYATPGEPIEVLVYETPRNHKYGGGNVAFDDGNGRFFPRKKVLEKIINEIKSGKSPNIEEF